MKFFRSLEMDGDAFMVASPEEVEAERRSLCLKQMVGQDTHDENQ
jgi:hypothetical protein